MRFDLRDAQRHPWVVAALATACLVVALTLAGLLLRWVPYSFGRDGVQAVFLAGGQVYFGRIAGETSRSVVLTDVYYLKLATPVTSQDDLQNRSDASLVKLGNELHAPEDRMEIPWDQVLYVERLKPDGRVAKAIAQYQTQGAAPTN